MIVTNFPLLYSEGNNYDGDIFKGWALSENGSVVESFVITDKNNYVSSTANYVTLYPVFSNPATVVQTQDTSSTTADSEVANGSETDTTNKTGTTFSTAPPVDLSSVPGFNDNNGDVQPNEGDTVTVGYYYTDINNKRQEEFFDFPYTESILTDFPDSIYCIDVKKFPDCYENGKSYDDKNQKKLVFTGWKFEDSEIDYIQHFYIYDFSNHIRGKEYNEKNITICPVFMEENKIEEIRSVTYTLNLIEDKKAQNLNVINTLQVEFKYKWNYVKKESSPYEQKKITIGSVQGYDVISWENEWGELFKVDEDIYDYLVRRHSSGALGDTVNFYAVFADEPGIGGSETSKTTADPPPTFIEPEVTTLNSLVISDFLDEIARCDSKFDKNTKNIAFYDIHLRKGGRIVPSGDGKSYRVTIPYPCKIARDYKAYKFKLYHLRSDGTVEIVPVKSSRYGVVFESKKFRPYALTWSKRFSMGTSSNPRTEDGFSAVPFVSVGAVCILTIGGVLVYRKKKELAE